MGNFNIKDSNIRQEYNSSNTKEQLNKLKEICNIIEEVSL
jgi:hypothetical protein